MNDLIGSLAISSSGKDKGYFYLIYASTLNEVFLVDGNARKIKNPKKKNIKEMIQ